jgi:hypothetical protein
MPPLPTHRHKICQYFHRKHDRTQHHQHLYLRTLLQLSKDQQEGLREKKQQHDQTGTSIEPLLNTSVDLPSELRLFRPEIIELRLISTARKGVIDPHLSRHVPANVPHPLPTKRIA